LGIVARLFFPRVLDPVLDGGVGDEDPMITPEVPTGGAIRQSVLDDQTDGQPLDAAGIQALGRGEVGQVGGEATAATATAMPREGNEQVAGPLGAGIAEVMEATCIQGIAAGTPTTAWARPRGVVAGTPFETRRGEVFDPRDAFGGVGHIRAWSSHTRTSGDDGRRRFSLQVIDQDGGTPGATVSKKAGVMNLFANADSVC